MGNSSSKSTSSTTTTTTTTTVNTTTTTKTKSSGRHTEGKEEEIADVSPLANAVRLSTDTDKCKAELKQLLGECTTNRNLVDSVADFFEKNRSEIASSAATVAIAGALGISVLEASSNVGKKVSSALGVHHIGLGSILGGGSIVGASVGAVFSLVAVVTTGCLLFRKFRVLNESQKIKWEIVQKIEKLRGDMTDLLEKCNKDSFFEIEKRHFRDIRRQINCLYVVLRDVVKKLDKERKILKTGKKWMAVLSGAAIITGVILCFTGVGAAVGGGLIAGGITGLGCAYTLHRAEKEIEKEIEFYRNTWKCIQDLEFILIELERLQKTKLVNTKEKFEKKLNYLKTRNKNLFDKYMEVLAEEGLLQDYGCESFVPDNYKVLTLKDEKKEFKELFEGLEGRHENHLWVVVKGWVEDYCKIKSLFDTIFDEGKKNVAHHKQKQRNLVNGGGTN